MTKNILYTFPPSPKAVNFFPFQSRAILQSPLDSWKPKKVSHSSFPRKLQHTHPEHTPGNPPSQLWKESLYSLLVRLRSVFQRCVETTLDPLLSKVKSPGLPHFPVGARKGSGKLPGCRRSRVSTSHGSCRGKGLQNGWKKRLGNMRIWNNHITPYPSPLRFKPLISPTWDVL